MNYFRYDDACGAYSVYATADGFKSNYGFLDKTGEGFKSYNIRPSQMAPVIFVNDKGQTVLEEMKWGLIPSWWKEDPKISYKLFNARDDKVFTSGMWRSVYRKRALVPASGYYEWTKPPKGEEKQKYYYTLKQQELFSFAGFYDVWKDAGDRDWKTYTIITTEPNKEASKVHNRMPVILHKEDEQAWIDPTKTKRDEIEPFIHPLEDGGLKVVEVGNNTNAFKYDDEGLIKALNSK
ncbi:MAG TPA: SOS response-associated peptidase [Candidatus Saccharimonadales bacterium]|nr:SOS response-associated peptidase [Candidatus Saccharimonadales bacterium]